MRYYLGIDYGIRRIGLAVGDETARIASPLRTLEVRGGVTDHARDVIAAANRYQVDAFVLGLPVHMNGSEGEQAALTRRFGQELARVSGKPVHYHDERLSSFAAQELVDPAYPLPAKRHVLPSRRRRRRQANHDAVAAQLILQDFLEGLRRD